jgi:N-acyl-D-amino-acid deacylase
MRTVFILWIVFFLGACRGGEDRSRITAIRFLMSEASMAPESPFTEELPHPRAYGAFARVLGKYVREEGLISLQEAVRRMTGLPASNLRLDQRGLLQPGYYADVVVFDPATVSAHATFENPHQLATGVLHVFVNGGHVLRDGVHTGAKPGRFVKGPGSLKR